MAWCWTDDRQRAQPAAKSHITAPALSFPDCGTQRSSWRDSDVTITGDAELAARFLDAVNVI